jgi:hypothetical protein
MLVFPEFSKSILSPSVPILSQQVTFESAPLIIKYQVGDEFSRWMILIYEYTALSSYA